MSQDLDTYFKRESSNSLLRQVFSYQAELRLRYLSPLDNLYPTGQLRSQRWKACQIVTARIPVVLHVMPKLFPTLFLVVSSSVLNLQVSRTQVDADAWYSQCLQSGGLSSHNQSRRLRQEVFNSQIMPTGPVVADTCTTRHSNNKRG